jgi:hypothetical protein
MNLEKLKYEADFNQKLLIDKVEELVKIECDVDKLKKEIRAKYIGEVEEKIIKLMAKYIEAFRCITKENPHTERTIKSFLGSVGSIIREEDDKEI